MVNSLPLPNQVQPELVLDLGETVSSGDGLVMIQPILTKRQNKDRYVLFLYTAKSDEVITSFTSYVTNQLSKLTSNRA